MAVAIQRATRSHENPPYNSDSPRKRTRYSSNTALVNRQSSLTPKPRSRPPRGPRNEDSDRLLPLTSRGARRITSPDKPRYDSAADAAAAATGQMDGYKPREERSWEEFHQDLSLESQITVFSADEVDGFSPPLNAFTADQQTSPGPDGKQSNSDNEMGSTTPRRRPGRPPRRAESMLNGLGSPPAPKVVPLPAHNPREKLNLPKPSYRRVETFAAYEADKQSKQVNYVDRGLANVGFQEWENFIRTGQQLLRHVEDSWQDDPEPSLAVDIRQDEKLQNQQSSHVSRVEYDMDEQDEQWLEAHNNIRKTVEQVEAIKPPIFEIAMTQIEKEWHALERRIPKPNPKPPQTHRPRSSSAAAVNGEPAGAGEEQDSKCAICDDGDCENSNAIVFCDGCDLAVHQECYGVPYIPEGQWLCRKCQMIGVKTKPVCIFCPNFEGAFKQTTENRWAHLLCAIWIPEVTIANQTYQEPISDVAAVPPDRWNKLVCYICNQKMGACIQCGHSKCYVAFHVTCAKKAKLYLRQKSSHGTGPNMDASVLQALCHKHVPAEWQAEHESDRAVLRAQAYYRKRMKNIEWADSMKSATTAMTSQPLHALEALDENQEQNDAKGQSNLAALKKKRSLAQKNVWKLQSGAPIVPEVVQEAVEASLQRFSVHKRKEFVGEACKYWTMKRDSRRGAAMLKRLQLQLETFSANEVTRRNFAAMGPIGLTRLQRRLEMAERLIGELATVRGLCEQVKDREEARLQDADILRTITDTIYFPLPALLEPVLRKALGTVENRANFPRLAAVQYKLERRGYGSVSEFATDLGVAFSDVAGLENVEDVFEAHTVLCNSLPREEQLSNEDKELKKLAKRLVKAVQQPLKEAMLKEVELGGRDYNEQLQHLRESFDRGDHGSLPHHGRYGSGTHLSLSELTNSANVKATNETVNDGDRVNDNGPPKADIDDAATTNNTDVATRGPAHGSVKSTHTDPSNLANGTMSSTLNTTHTGQGKQGLHRSTLLDNLITLNFLSIGGKPWYLSDFEPVGISVQEEKWTGPEVMRGMSEELSEMDDEELQGLGPSSEIDGNEEVVATNDVTPRASTRARRQRR